MAKTNRGDRIIQIILLLLIAGGIGGSFLLISGGTGRTGGPRSAAGGLPPGGAPAGAGEGTNRPEVNTIAVEALRPERGTVSQSIKVNGDVTVETSIEIYPDTGGKLVSRSIRLGDRVRKGQIIAAVDPSVPGRVYSTSPVVSTIAGTVIELPFQVGATLTTQSIVAVIGDLSDLVILTYIPERYIASLKTGLTAEVGFDAYPGDIFHARIREISPVMDTDTRTLSVKLGLTENDARIRPGMFATIKLITKESPDTLSVPAGAVFNYYGEDAVYIAAPDGKAERRIVVRGMSTDRVVEILDGLAEGEQVITQGLSKITDGSLVRVVGLGEDG